MNKFKQFLYKIYRLSWKITKPQTIGVRAILTKEKKILLVKHTYSNQWFLSGGGLKKGETLEQAIKRELDEELGVKLKNLHLFGAYHNFFEGKKDYIIVFQSDDFSLPNKTDIEIETYAFFDINHLPEETSAGTRKRILELIENNASNYGSW